MEGGRSGNRIEFALICIKPQALFTYIFQQQKFEHMSDQIIGRLDDMGKRVDDLEKNINELMQQVDTREEPSPKK